MASAARRRRPTTMAGDATSPDQSPRQAHGEAVSAARTVGHSPPPEQTYAGRLADTPRRFDATSTQASKPHHLLQRTSGENSVFANPWHLWKGTSQSVALGIAQPQSSQRGQTPICQQSQSHLNNAQGRDTHAKPTKPLACRLPPGRPSQRPFDHGFDHGRNPHGLTQPQGKPTQ